MNFIKNIKNMFSGSSGELEETSPVAGTEDSPIESLVTNPEHPPNKTEAPVIRRVIRAPVASNDLFPPDDPEKVLIRAQPSTTGDQCLFMVNRPLLPGYSWWFPTFESAAGSPLTERLFSLDDVESVLIHEATVTVTRKDKTIFDWKPLGAEIGAAIREALEEGGDLIAETIVNEMPSEEAVRHGIQKAIDEEVNPGVAGHGGRITLEKVKGNTITIQMGGGCQGCSAADVTLKQGIHGSFRKFVPQVGAIFDETDHTAGLNPYF